jgi:regulator of sigma E protease
MIVIHELGHFIVAKLLGIAVETFSVGFGPRLIGFRVGETDYRLSAIPLGGYVKFRGENLELLQGKSEGSVDEFLSHPKWKRFLVAVAGPAFNIATAILIPTVAILIGFQESIHRSQPITIGKVLPDSAAERAGLQPGDRILAFNHKQNPVWEDFVLEVRLRPNEEIPLTIERKGQMINLTVQPQAETVRNEQVGRVGIEPYIGSIRIGKVSPGSPAAIAGLQTDDRITAINGEPLTTWSQFIQTLEDNVGKELILQLQRDQKVLALKVTPSADKQYERELGLGVVPNLTMLVKTSSLATALRFGWDYNWRILRSTGVVFKQIFSGRRSAGSALAGPIGIARTTAETYRDAGWAGIIELMGILSLNLGVFNLLPIPVLDGGMILMIFIEALLGLLGLTLTMAMRERFQQLGFIVIMLLMGFVIVNDIVKWGSSSTGDPPPAQQPNR